MARVFLKDVKKIYDNGFEAVKGANLNIADKEFMVIVGPSGCGKTTTLRMIAGLEDISDGTITIGDKVVNDVPPKDRDIAMVFQNYALYPHMTVFQNLAFSLKLRKYPKDEIKKRVTEVAEMLDISSQLDKKPKALSGGQRQRVALGRAIVRNPAAFLFDEPLSNLDAKLRVTTRAELKALHRRLNTTSIYVTHDQAEAMTLGDRICVMYNGEIQQVAPPMEVYDKPVNRFVAGFLGTPPMNFLKGKISSQNGKIVFILNDGDVVEIKSTGSRFKNYIDKEMVLGVRPEHLTVEPLAGQMNNGIKSKVNVVEPLGDRKDIYLTSTSGQKFIANLDPHTSLDVDHLVTMYIDVNKLHIFELGETGENISIS
ncbi:MAG: sn-glycerol-3-phosphate ABC transporter ATP-binding protein UgpC [Planctomycetaceae bacterium]|nr:sn-glycerol-3-phosphate ABC transporter ATP-binding protein UgpC [Planctomycetaceae bacterium]